MIAADAQGPALEFVTSSAAGHATMRVPIAEPTDRVGSVRDRLVGEEFDCADDIAVVADDMLAGIVPIERLLAADGATTIDAIMDSDPPAVEPGVDQEAVAWKMVRKGESSVAVIDTDGRFAGLISPHRMLSVLLAEHDEDLARIGGYMSGNTRAREAAEEPVGRRLWHRLPWLLIGLVGAMTSAVLVGSFEEELARNVLLAFFVPAVVYMADAVGTQTEAVLIRGLAAGVSIRAVARRELISGAIIGVAIGLVFYPFALLGWGDSRAAVAISLALFCSCAVATIVAMTLPLIFQRKGLDPAFGSGPLSTVVQDLLSIAIYFAIAVPLTR